MTESSSGTVLWQLNQEYLRRLASARTHLGLLLELLATRIRAGEADLDDDLPPLLRYTDDCLTRLHDDHRTWRYGYFYESPDTKRAVQTERGIQRALAQFALMRGRHDRLLRELALLYDAVPQPAPGITSVVNADLWGLFLMALNELLVFDTYARSLQTR
jgi:hypothetical protein